MEERDVVVVGAGPAGTHVARLLAERGLDVLALEEHPQVGRPVQCAGLVTPRVFDHAAVDVGAIWQNDLRGAIVHAPGGASVRFETDAVQAVAMDRAGFDVAMAQAAVAAGAEVRPGAKATGVRRRSDGRVDVAVGEETVRTRLVIGADGIRSRTAHWFGLPAVREIVSAYEVELSGCHIPAGEEHLIPMFAGGRQAPGFFSWIIPIGGGKTRSGLAVAPGMSEAAARVYYERMFDDPMSAPYLDGSKEEYRIIGGIPLGLRRQLIAPGYAALGDAAGMAKPTSGGGILLALMAAEALAPVAAGAVREGATVERLAAYEWAVRRRLAPELRRGERLRALFTRLRDGDLDAMATALARPRARSAIERHGDIDYPSRLVAPLLLAAPGMAGIFARALVRGAPSRSMRVPEATA